jgi:hypothetical protein
MGLDIACRPSIDDDGVSPFSNFLNNVSTMARAQSFARELMTSSKTTTMGVPTDASTSIAPA